jgi:hypothetical protein
MVLFAALHCVVNAAEVVVAAAVGVSACRHAIESVRRLWLYLFERRSGAERRRTVMYVVPERRSGVDRRLVDRRRESSLLAA